MIGSGKSKQPAGPRLFQRAHWLIVAALAFATPTGHAAVNNSTPAPKIATSQLYFEENVGQADGSVEYFARGQACQFFVTPTEAFLSLSQITPQSLSPESARPARSIATAATWRTVRLQIVDANPQARVVPEDKLPGRVNYFLGQNPADWHRNVSTFSRVRVKKIYPGIDLVYYGNQSRLEYDFIVSPDTDPTKIAVRFVGPEKLRLNAAGDLILSIGTHEIVQPKPAIYQEIGGIRHAINGEYRFVDAQTVGFSIGDYDTKLPLVIDPVLSFSTYYGGSGMDAARAVVVDANGAIYVAGETLSAVLPLSDNTITNGGYSGGTALHGDAFVARFSNDGSELEYLAYLGGRLNDVAFGLALDADGNAYVAGYTDSTNFPATGIFTNIAGPPSAELKVFPIDGFVTKLGPNGTNIIFSTYLGGSDIDECLGIALDPDRNVYVTGYTQSTNFPTANVVSGLTNYAGNGDAFVAKINAAGSALVYASYLGGAQEDAGDDIAADAAGFAYVTGYTGSTNFPPWTNALQSRLNTLTNSSTAFDAFVTKLTPGEAPMEIVNSHLLGGTNNDYGFRLALDGDANVYVTGSTRSGNFPGASTNFPSSVISNDVDADVFIAKLDASATNRIYSVVFGGSGVEQGWDIAVGPGGHAHVTGATSSPNFPTNATAGFLRGTNAGSSDAFVAELNSDGTALVYSAYLGGAGADIGYGIDVDAQGTAYVAGSTTSLNFPLVSASLPSFQGVADAFLAKITSSQPVSPELAASSDGTNLVLSWTALASDFVLQSNTNVAAANGWTDVESSAVVTNGMTTITVSPTNEALFFRLRQP